jgi:hypothetical protein
MNNREGPMSDFKSRMLSRSRSLPARQRGAMTMFSAILILILLTELVLYATQVGVFEQRKSANDMRQKQAFHAAEAGLQNAKEFFLANVQFLSFPGENGWLDLGSGTDRWVACANADFANPNHPCSGEAFPDTEALADLRSSIEAGTFYYSWDDELNPQEDDTLVPINTAADADENPDLLDRLTPMGQRVEVQALLCVLDLNRAAVPPDPAVRGCIAAGDPIPEGQHIYFMLTLLAKGQAACADPGDPVTCEAEALVSEKLGSFGPASGNGGPGVPLTARSAFPPSGNAEIVPNPNGGGPGVPISAWINGRPDGDLCPGQEVPYDPSGSSWSSCERHEWYGVDALPEDYLCPGSCACESSERRLTYAEGGTQIIGIDIVVDPLFPCNLFEATFGVEKTLEAFNLLKSTVGIEIDDCGILDETSAGVYWMTGDTCQINGGTTVGSPEFPVFLVSAAETTTLNGGVNLFGVVYITDILNAEPEFNALGTNTVYGALVADLLTEMDFGGDFELVYVDAIVDLASQSGGIGKVTGGWSDFHPVWQGRAES